jgi:hypothetical protein
LIADWAGESVTVAACTYIKGCTGTVEHYAWETGKNYVERKVGDEIMHAITGN